jgi:hypothetical protein
MYLLKKQLFVKYELTIHSYQYSLPKRNISIQTVYTFLDYNCEGALSEKT